MGKSCKLYVIALCLGLIPSLTWGQDMHFSQFMESPLTLNPALTGSFNGDIRIITNYKDQWRSVANPYQTFSLSYDMGLLKEQIETGRLAAGLVIYRDMAGDTKYGTTLANFSTSYQVHLNDNNGLSAGLQAGFAQKTMDNTVLEWPNQYDAGVGGHNSSFSSEETMPIENFTYLDISSGLVWSYAQENATMASNDDFMMRLGISMYHANKPKFSFSDALQQKLPAKLSIHGDAKIGIKNTNLALVPSVMVLLQGASKQILMGNMFRYRLSDESKYTGFIKESAVFLGGHYRIGDAFIPSVYFEISSFST